MDKLIDTHCHLNSPELRENISEIIEEARQFQIDHWLIPATEMTQWPDLRRISLSDTSIKIALGIHPWFVNADSNASLSNLKQLCIQNTSTIVAIGEIGLDRLKPEWELQLSIFEQQLAIAVALDLPTIIHSVKAHQDVVSLLKKCGVGRGIIHAYTGNLQQAESFVRLGMHIGVGTSITYERASKTRNAIAQLPLESLVLETDAPYMPVCGFQGQVSKPKQLRLVFEALCELRAEPAESIASQLRKNSLSLFNLGQIR